MLRVICIMIISKCQFSKVRTRCREMRQLQKEVAGKKSQLSAENEQAEEEATKRLMEMEAVIEIKKIIDPVDTSDPEPFSREPQVLTFQWSMKSKDS